MGSLADLQKQLIQKDERIAVLERHIRQKDDLIRERDALIQELRCQLDKYQSIIPAVSRKAVIQNGPRTKRANGISAEPQGVRFGGIYLTELKQKYPKNER